MPATTACSALRLQRRVHGIRVLRLPARSGRQQGTRQRSRSPGRTSTTAWRSTSRTTSRSRPQLTLNLGMRWAYTQPVVEKDNRQSNFDLTTGAQIFAEDGSRESRALYKAYKKGFEPRLGVAWRPDDRWVVRGALRHLAVHGRHRRQPPAAAQPAVLLRVGRRLRRDDRRRERWRQASPS